MGLPVPLLERGGSSPLSAASLEPQLVIGPGTAPELAEGPFHPVVGSVGYGEFAARFGGGRSHEGQDVFAKPGTPLVAVRDGVVVDRGTVNGEYAGGRGNYLAIYSEAEGRSYVYLHLLHPALVQKGQRVLAGQVIGQLGCTGSCYGPHLHFEVRIGSALFGADTKPIDPLPLLRRLPQAPFEPALEPAPTATPPPPAPAPATAPTPAKAAPPKKG